MSSTLHLISSTDRRGAQVFASQLAHELGGMPEHPVVAIEPGTGAHPLHCAVLGERRWDPAGFVRLVAGARRCRVLLAHGSSALLHGAAAAAGAGRPFVYRNIGDPAAWGRVRAADVRIGAPLRRAAAVAALYPGARTHLVEAYSLDPERVVTIPNGVPMVPAADDDERADARHALGLVGSLGWVAFVGALSEEKGVLAAVRAVAADPDLGLVVAGDGPERAAAEQLAEAEAPGRVRFLGVTDRPRTVLAAADVVVLPSRTEGIPAVAIEAGLCGRPVVATAVGGLPEVVVDTATGRLVAEPAPEVLTPALREAIDHGPAWGAAGRARCLERFTIEQVARQWDEVLLAVAQDRRPASSR